MTGKPSKHPDKSTAVSTPEGDTLQGWIPDIADRKELFEALNKAFDYRGDVTITRRDGSTLEGYIFDRRTGQSLDDSSVRLMPVDTDDKVEVRYADIARLEFTGKDTAAGKSFENWIKRYVEKKQAGEKASIESESLD
ncbi:hypothetical protein HED60_22035 [Planctomycetales bacterium ZRK34]|nr:hypothetical protein HED60_22035 [Planctomycetales bacterium ZRK34]